MKLFKLYSIYASLALMAFASCSDDDAKTPLSIPQGEVSDIAYTSLTFDWNNVPGALQYGYELVDDEDNVCESGVTHDTYITVTDLKPATGYTMTVLAFAAVDGSNTTSEPLVMKATTLAAATLQAPDLKLEVDGRYAMVTWNAIPDSNGYSYILSRDGEIEEEGTVDTEDLTLAALDPGAYILTVSSVASSDAYANNETTISFDIERSEIWRVTGTYTSALIDGSWPVTMIAYSDDSYELVDFYMTYNVNLNFYVDKFDEDEPFKMSDSEYAYDEDTESYAVHVNRSGLEYLYVYPNSTRFTMSGDKNGGTLVVAVNNRSTTLQPKRDRFVWGTDLN